MKQHTALIPPDSEDVDVYGGDDVIERARRCAVDHQYLLYDGPSDRCVHGLYRMDVCSFSACKSVGMDHARIWVQGDWPLWPIERDAALVLHTQPVSRPADE